MKGGSSESIHCNAVFLLTCILLEWACVQKVHSSSVRAPNCTANRCGVRHPFSWDVQCRIGVVQPMCSFMHCLMINGVFDLYTCLLGDTIYDKIYVYMQDYIIIILFLYGIICSHHALPDDKWDVWSIYSACLSRRGGWTYINIQLWKGIYMRSSSYSYFYMAIVCISSSNHNDSSYQFQVVVMLLSFIFKSLSESPYALFLILSSLSQ